MCFSKIFVLPHVLFDYAKSCFDLMFDGELARQKYSLPQRIGSSYSIQTCKQAIWRELPFSFCIGLFAAEKDKKMMYFELY